MNIDVPGDPPAGVHLLLSDPSGELGWLSERIAVETADQGLTPLAESYARAFLYLVERMWESGIPVRHDLADLAAQYMFVHLNEPLTVPLVAEAMNVSVSHLAHSCSARLGVSPLRFLQRIRLEEAERLLSNSDLPVQEIAVRVGFPDPLYFSRTFRRNRGLSPTMFRQAYRSAE